MSTQTARLQLRIAPESKQLIERAAELSNRSVTAFVTDVVVARAREVVEGPSARASPTESRRLGGWSFDLPTGWNEPLDDLAEYRGAAGGVGRGGSRRDGESAEKASQGE